MAEQHMPEHFGQQPKASPAARTWAVILGLLLLAAGVVSTSALGLMAWVVYRPLPGAAVLAVAYLMPLGVLGLRGGPDRRGATTGRRRRPGRGAS